jgi:hypothetical protein
MKLIKIALILTAAIYVTGCASGAKKENMTYQGEQKAYSEDIKQSVGLSDVSGGEKTNPAWTSEISGEAFSGAVRDSLQAQGLLSDAGIYKLSVKLIEVEQPMFGLDLEVTTHVQYTLTNSTDNSVVFDELIVAPHTATFGDSFAAVKRLRLANEGSGMKNIEQFLEKLAELKISKDQISLAK